jgi:hypothetical protein
MRTVMLALGLAVMWLNVFAGIGGLASGKAGMAMAAGEGDTNAFNPYMRKELPNVQDIPIEGKEMMQQIGSVAQSIKGEAAHRPH